MFEKKSVIYYFIEELDVDTTQLDEVNITSL